MNKGEITYTIKVKKRTGPIMEYDILACILYGRAASIDLLMAFQGVSHYFGFASGTLLPGMVQTNNKISIWDSKQ